MFRYRSLVAVDFVSTSVLVLGLKWLTPMAPPVVSRRFFGACTRYSGTWPRPLPRLCPRARATARVAAAGT